MSAEKFEAVIGLEIHAQISTDTKMFCSCSADSFEKPPNLNVCPICMGFPGQLPVINREAVRRGIKAGIALHCSIPPFSKFDRKNYFYPDLPKGYQISQFDEPVAQKGWLEISSGEGKRRIGITRLHLEDDAGKLTHISNGTLCDYNRSGVPLMEIVSDPDMHNAEEAGAYAREIQKILRYVGASEADMEKGMMRFDASVSIRPVGDSKLYPRAEIKNLNSFRSLESAIDYEIERQIFLWEEGKPQDKDVTVGWTDDKGETYFLRDKEGADDYRYFPEPDLPPMEIGQDFIEQLAKEVPELPSAKKERYIGEFEMAEHDADLISSDAGLAGIFESVFESTGDLKKTVSFISTILIGHLKKNGLDLRDSKITAENLSTLIKLVNNGEISSSAARNEIFEEMFNTGDNPDVIVDRLGLKQVSDSGELEAVCDEVISENEKSVVDFKNGKGQALGFLVGQVMKKSKGQANPQMVNQILNKKINS